MDSFLIFVLGALTGAVTVVLVDALGRELAKRAYAAHREAAPERPSSTPAHTLTAFDVQTDDELAAYLNALEQLDETSSRLRAQ